MMLNTYIIFVLTIVNSFGVIKTYNAYKKNDIGSFHRFTMSNELLYVGGERGIVALWKSNLSVSNIKNNESRNIWLILYGKGKNTVTECSQLNDTTSSCRELDSTLSNPINGSQFGINKTDLRAYIQTEVPNSSAQSTTVLVLSATSIRYETKTYGIITLDLDNFTIFDTKKNGFGPMNLEIGPEFEIVFKSVISLDSFVFFFFNVYDKKNIFKKSRVGKLCKKRKGVKQMDGYYHSYKDIGLRCKVSDEPFQMVEKAILVNNKTFLVIFKDGKTHAVCTFSVESVINKLTSERKDKLGCIYYKYGSYFKQNLLVNGTQCFENEDCKGDYKPCSKVSEVPCETGNNNTLLDGATLETNTSIISGSDQLTAVAVQLTTQNRTIMYFGTANGSIIMVSTKQRDDGQFEKYEQKQVKISSSKILDILIDDILGVFVLSAKQVSNLCSGYDNCSSCINSFNTVCGWSISEERCSTFDNHSTNMISANDKCYEWKNDQKKRLIKTMQGEKNMQVFFSKPSSIDGKLSFKFEEDKSIVLEIGRDCNCTCAEVKYKNLTSGNYTLVLMQDDKKVASTELELIVCEDLNSCKECIRYECGWNLNEVHCRTQGYDIGQMSKCPTLDEKSVQLKQIYYRKQTIEVDLYSWPGGVSVPSLKCVMTNGSSEIISPATVNQTTPSVICNLTALGAHLLLNMIYNVRLLYEEDGSYIDGFQEVEVYTCKSNLSDNQGCKECKHQSYPVDCQWCQTGFCYSPEMEPSNCSTSEVICPIKLNSVYPTTGPVNGGTFVTLHGQNFVNSMTVELDAAECNVTKIHTDFNQLECSMMEARKQLTITNMTIHVNKSSFAQYEANGWFKFREPNFTAFYPQRSIKSGGRSIYLFGRNIGFKGPGRYKINFCKGMNTCAECRHVHTINGTTISCLSGNVSTPMVFTRIELIIDRYTILKLNQSFTYVKDPSGFALSNETSSAQQSGGTKITINGEGFNEVGQVTIDRVEKPCDIESDTLVQCETPEYAGNSTLTGKVSETVNVHFDGRTVPITINYVGDPMFEKYQDIVKYEKGSTIEIKGNNILTGARWNDYIIFVGKTGLCNTEKEHVTDTNIKCWPPQHVPLTNYTDRSLVYVHVQVGRLREHIGVLQYLEETNYLVIVIIILTAALVIAVGLGVGVTFMMRKKRKKAEKKFIFELQSVEERVRTNSREEFAETQIAIGDIQSDLVTSKVPYRDYQTYILLQLFPNQDPYSNSLLLDLQVSNGGNGKYKRAVEKLELLLQNKIFLKSLVQTLERPNTLTVREKAEFAALLSIALMGKMRLFYDLVHCLLTDSIRSVTKRQQRGLFRRLDSITCRMMTHWLQIVLFKQLQGQSGLQLFILLKAVQTVMERGPVDAVTGHCKNTLCEEKLLKLRVDCAQYILNIDLNGNPDHCYQVKVLECDTISQVKRKCCAQIYKNKPASEIPKFEELELGKYIHLYIRSDIIRVTRMFSKTTQY